MTSTYRKKLIEVALPLDAINKESAREKSIRHGHPSTLHLWWARRPLAACRAVLFSSLVTDPDDDPMYGVDEEIAATERAKLFDLIEDLVKWENSNNPDVINRARREIARSIAAEKVADGELADDMSLVAGAPELPEDQAKYLPEPPPEYSPHDLKHKLASAEQVNHFLAHYAPPVLDPFAGGGSIPLEAQRLGLRVYASDLNPVAVLINKALIEIPPKFANLPPVNPESRKGNLKTKQWHGAQGLAEDVRYYGRWIRDEAAKRIGHLYPKVSITDAVAADRPDLEPYIGQDLTVIAWLWARTVECPNPACRARMPMVRSFWLSKKKGKAWYARPILDHENKTVRFEIGNHGEAPVHTSDRSSARCLFCETSVKKPQLREQACAHGVEQIPLAVVAEGQGGRIYLRPEITSIPSVERPYVEALDQNITNDKRWFSPPLYGLPKFSDLFTSRQLVALTTLSDLVGESRNHVLEAARLAVSSVPNTTRSFDPEGYANAIATYLAFGVDKNTLTNCTLATWQANPDRLTQTLSRQALPMAWDFAEANPLSSAGGGYVLTLTSLGEVLERLPGHVLCSGGVRQADAADLDIGSRPAICTDPPYYDNIGYADLSDYFYVWLRRTLAGVQPDLFATLLTPKEAELIASAHRHDGRKVAAKQFFEKGLSGVIQRIRSTASRGTPVTIFYAFKQAESQEHGIASTGWETFLEAVVGNSFLITGTWPVRTELTVSLKKQVSALASSIVLVCRPRLNDTTRVFRRDFRTALKNELPAALRNLQHGNIAPVDLAQAAIGPGMAVFSRYAAVLEQDGSKMSVRTALAIINEVLDEVLTEQEGEFDNDTRFALKWFEQYAHDDGPFGDANTLANALAIGINGLEDAGILTAKSGKVRLLRREALSEKWSPSSDKRLTLWECVQHLIRELEQGGESGGAEVLGAIQQARGSEFGEFARDLAYRLYNTCERKNWATEARSYNGLVVSWPEIVKLARETRGKQTQTELF